MRSRHARFRAALAALCPCDRQGGSRRQLPAERKRRQYETRVLLWRDDAASPHAPVRRAVRDALIDARKCVEDRDAEALFEHAERFRARSTGFAIKHTSIYDRSVSWSPTRVVITTRERVDDGLDRRVAAFGQRHLMAVSRPGGMYAMRVGRLYWRVVRVDEDAYRRSFSGLLRSWMRVRAPLSVRVARRLHALLHDGAGAIELGPTNRWCGAMRWNRSWLLNFLAREPSLRAALDAWMRAQLGDAFAPWA